MPRRSAAWANRSWRCYETRARPARSVSARGVHTRDLLNVALRGREKNKSIPDEWMVGSVCTLATLPPAAQLLHYSGPKPWTAAGDINAK